MAIVLLVACPALGSVLLVLTGALRVRRYSRSHLVGRLTVRGRGIYFSRTPDGDWWALRLRRRRCEESGGGESPPDMGVREPRRPIGPRPASGLRIPLPY